MLLSDFLRRAAALEQAARDALAAVEPGVRLDAAKGALNAATGDELTALRGALRALPPEDRRDAGQAFNQVNATLAALLEEHAARSRAEASGPALDLTMPGRRAWQGGRHPVTLVIDEIVAIFRELGFTVAAGPEVEHPWYNFGALNFPPDHPAMEMHDTLYLNDEALLRTHTSPVQVRTLQQYAPPLRVLIPGNVYRRDFFDATHAPMFAQLEGMAVDEGISFVDLKATLAEFARRFYGGARRVRFGPSYFPFTEPSAQMDVEVDLQDGRGLRWMEIMGCGLMHPAVLEAAGLDAERYAGWAFGMGPGRIAMSRYEVPDIRLLYDSDVRFLEQFTR